MFALYRQLAVRVFWVNSPIVMERSDKDDLQSLQESGVKYESASDQPSVAPTGKRQAFRDLRRQLTDDELSGPGVQKLILDELEQSEAECEVLQGYIQRYHEADKRAAVLEERTKTARVIEILHGAMLALGGAIIGLTPVFWPNRLLTFLTLSLGSLLVLLAVIARILKQ